MVDNPILWYPLLEATGQTLVTMIGHYVGGKIISKIFKKNHFVGAQDLWYKGILSENVEVEDRITVDCTLSCFFQVFPGNPFENAERWDRLYEFSGTIDKHMFQTLDFSAGSDSALRVGSVNGETIIGIYNQYGYVGEGIIGVVPTRTLVKTIPEALEPAFIAKRALIGGRLARCPAQHGFVLQSLCKAAGINISLPDYKKLWYVQVDWIKPYKKEEGKYLSLLGAPWAATTDREHPYILSYGYLNEKHELKRCIHNISSSKYWKKASVYFDDIDCPQKDLSFKDKFIS